MKVLRIRKVILLLDLFNLVHTAPTTFAPEEYDYTQEKIDSSPNMFKDGENIWYADEVSYNKTMMEIRLLN